MCLLPSPWLDTTGLCSGDEHGCEKWLTESLGMGYAHKEDKIGFFANMTTVLPPSAHVGDIRGPFRCHGNHPTTGHRPKHPRNGKTA
jgi:hypothetical protein